MGHELSLALTVCGMSNSRKEATKQHLRVMGTESIEAGIVLEDWVGFIPRHRE